MKSLQPAGPISSSTLGAKQRDGRQLVVASCPVTNSAEAGAVREVATARSAHQYVVYCDFYLSLLNSSLNLIAAGAVAQVGLRTLV